MTWSVEELREAPVDRVLSWANQRVPTLRQMHAIKELAMRASGQPELLPSALSAIVTHLGHASLVGGLPAGYLGAKVLHDEGDASRRTLMTSLAEAAPNERDDLLRWLQPEPAPIRPDVAATTEKELIFESYVGSEQVEEAIRNVLRSPVSELKTELLRLARKPEAVAMINLSVEHWVELEHRGEQLSRALKTTVYWLPSEDLGPLDPDLRVAVGPDGRRELVVARYTAEGFEVGPYVGPTLT